MDTKRLIDVNNFSVSFDTPAGEVQAVRNASFYVEQGEIVAIVGESGSGKSVMTQSLLKLLPSPPAKLKSDSIVFDGRDISKFKRKQLMDIKGAEISYVFQDPMTSLNPTMKVGNQIVECIRKHKRISRKEAKADAINLLRLTGIPNPEKRYSQYPHEMSGGMRQRAMIAMAISCRPKLLIADEPTTALDVTIQSQILEILKDLNKEFGMSIILITHDLGIVANVASRVMVMYGGRIIENSNVADIYRNPEHPYTSALLKSVPRLDIDTKKSLDYIIGSPPNMLQPPEGCAFAPRCKYCMQVCKTYYPPIIGNELHHTACWLLHEMADGIREKVDKQVNIDG